MSMAASESASEVFAGRGNEGAEGVASTATGSDEISSITSLNHASCQGVG